MMRIWYDACAGKHVRYGVAIAKRLRELGHEVVLTTRQHPDNIPLARFLKEDFIVVGKIIIANIVKKIYH
jgi:predicted glycosyltransferase